MCVHLGVRKPTMWCRSSEEFLRRDFSTALEESAEGRYTDVWIERRTVTEWRQNRAC